MIVSKEEVDVKDVSKVLKEFPNAYKGKENVLLIKDSLIYYLDWIQLLRN